MNFLAGRARSADALPQLRALNRGQLPHPLANPLGFMRAKEELGEAISRATGDDAGACAAYKDVLERWGNAKRSETLSAANARAKAIGCAR